MDYLICNANKTHIFDLRHEKKVNIWLRCTVPSALHICSKFITDLSMYNVLYNYSVHCSLRGCTMYNIPYFFIIVFIELYIWEYRCTMFITGVQRLLQVYNVYYRCTTFITDVQCLFKVYNVYYRCTMFITGVQCLLQMYNVYLRCTTFITDVQCLLQVYNVYYRCTIFITGVQHF